MTTRKYEASGVQAEFEPGSRNRVLRNLLGIVRVGDMEQAESEQLERIQREAVALILIHPFRDGNGRLARMLAVLMALQAGLPELDFAPLAGRGKRRYVAAIHAAMGRDYKPLQGLFRRAIDRTVASNRR